VPPDVWPDNPESLAPEMEVADCLAHIRDVDRFSLAKAVPRFLHAARGKSVVCTPEFRGVWILTLEIAHRTRSFMIERNASPG
jgi:hypothetical protein